MTYLGVAAIVFAFCFSALLTAVVRALAWRLGFIDVPAKHKTHGRPVALLGGMAIFMAILVPALGALSLARIWNAAGVPQWLAQAAPSVAVHIPGAASKAMTALGILAGAFVLHVVGLIDDRKNLGPWLKLTAQVLVSVFVVVVLDVRILTMAGKTFSVLATIIWLVTITNAFNFLDNMDGLSAGVAAICAAALLAAAAGIGQVFVAAWLCLILGALLGFLPYNFSPASIFMGDAGSLVVGFLLGVLGCLTTYVSPQQQMYSFMAPLVLMAVPLYDTISVIILRIRAKANPMIGDRRHFSHRLVRRGMNTRAAVLTVYLCTATTALSATLLPHVDFPGAIMVFGQTVAILLIIALLESGDVKK